MARRRGPLSSCGELGTWTLAPPVVEARAALARASERGGGRRTKQNEVEVVEERGKKDGSISTPPAAPSRRDIGHEKGGQFNAPGHSAARAESKMKTFHAIIIASIFLLQHACSFVLIVPITNGPTLNKKQSKAAGIGGMGGIKELSGGGLGAAKIGGKKDTKNSKAPAAKKATNKKAAAADSKKEKPSFFIKTPWSK